MLANVLEEAKIIGALLLFVNTETSGVTANDDVLLTDEQIRECLVFCADNSINPSIYTDNIK